jgi:hypothetical protein
MTSVSPLKISTGLPRISVTESETKARFVADSGIVLDLCRFSLACNPAMRGIGAGLCLNNAGTVLPA